MICELCKRESDDTSLFTKHHTNPKSEGGAKKGTEVLCYICHNQIHMLIDNKTLDRQYDTIEKLMTREDVRKFVRWVKKQPIDRYFKSRMSNNKKRRMS